MLKRRLLKSSKNIKKISILTFAVLSFALAAYAAVTSTGKPLDYESVPSATGGAYINTVGASQVNYPIEFAEDYFRGPNAEYLEGLPGFTADKRAGDNSQTAGDLQKFTTHEELITFIRSLPTTNMTVQIIGDYPKGLEWRCLFSAARKLRSRQAMPCARLASRSFSSVAQYMEERLAPESLNSSRQNVLLKVMRIWPVSLTKYP